MNDNPPLVTIAIPTYRQERFIGDAVSSALAQTYPNLEVIVADDCSPDGTDSICQKFTADPRFRYVRSISNYGRVGNYRHIIRNLARGDWYLNLDGDDYLTDRDYISEAMKVARCDPGIVLVWGNALVAWEGATVAPLMSSRFGAPIIMKGEDLILVHPPFLSSISPPHLASIIRRDVALASDFYRDGGLCCDSESVYRVGFGHKVAVIDRVAGVWRQHGANDSHTMVDQIHASNVSRSAGILQWGEATGTFSGARLDKLRRTLEAGDGVAYFAREALAGRIRHMPKALLRAMVMYPRSSHRIAFWAAQRVTRTVARRVAGRIVRATYPSIADRLTKGLVERVPPVSELRA